MCSFHYAPDFPGYFEVLYHPKTVPLYFIEKIASDGISNYWKYNDGYMVWRKIWEKVFFQWLAFPSGILIRFPPFFSSILIILVSLETGSKPYIQIFAIHGSWINIFLSNMYFFVFSYVDVFLFLFLEGLEPTIDDNTFLNYDHRGIIFLFLQNYTQLIMIIE